MIGIYTRRAVIARLRLQQPQITRLVLQLLVWPDAYEHAHWKHDLVVRGNNLAAMSLRTFRGGRPLGFNLVWRYLYREPFQGVEQRVLSFLLRALSQEYERPI